MTEDITPMDMEIPALPKAKGDTAAMAALYAKKAAVTSLLEGGIPKEGTHPKFKYTDASDVKKSIGQAMAHVGLTLHMTVAEYKRIPLPSYVSNGKESKDAELAHVWFYMTLCDGETGATEPTLWLGEAVLYGHDDRGFTKAATSAQKSFLIDTFLVGEKDDTPSRGQQSSRQSAERPQRPPAQTPAPRADAPVTAPPSDVILSSRDEQKWPKFLAWAKDKFKYEEKVVREALAAHLDKDGEYNASRDMAMGTLLAMFSGYDADIIEDTGARLKLTDAVIQEATLIRNPAPVEKPIPVR